MHFGRTLYLSCCHLLFLNGLFVSAHLSACAFVVICARFRVVSQVRILLSKVPLAQITGQLGLIPRHVVPSFDRSLRFTPLIAPVPRHSQIHLISIFGLLVSIWVQKRIVNVWLVKDVHHIVNDFLIGSRLGLFIYLCVELVLEFVDKVLLVLARGVRRGSSLLFWLCDLHAILDLLYKLLRAFLFLL